MAAITTTASRARQSTIAGIVAAIILSLLSSPAVPNPVTRHYVVRNPDGSEHSAAIIDTVPIEFFKDRAGAAVEKTTALVLKGETSLLRPDLLYEAAQRSLPKHQGHPSREAAEQETVA